MRVQSPLSFHRDIEIAFRLLQMSHGRREIAELHSIVLKHSGAWGFCCHDGAYRGFFRDPVALTYKCPGTLSGETGLQSPHNLRYWPDLAENIRYNLRIEREE